MSSGILSIRDEQHADRWAIRSVHTAAFGGTLEADLVDHLRQSCKERVSLVAVLKSTLVGHVLFTPAQIDSPGRRIEGWALAPMAVLPEYQRRSIGTLLVESGLAELRRRKAPFVVVLGHPRYYPRFGFEVASRWTIRSEWDVPDEAFMVLPLDSRGLEGANGIVSYRPEFHESAGLDSEGQDAGRPG